MNVKSKSEAILFMVFLFAMQACLPAIKSESRNPKSETNSKSKCFKVQNENPALFLLVIRIWIIVSDFVLQISKFELPDASLSDVNQSTPPR
jgi:hypothetical protein